MSALITLFGTEIDRDFIKLFEGGFEVYDDLLGEHIGIGKVVNPSNLSSRSPQISGLALSGLKTSLSTLSSPFTRNSDLNSLSPLYR